MPRTAHAVVVLDNEALQALDDPAHPKHRRLLEVLAASRSRPTRVVTTTAARVEAGTVVGARSALGRFHVDDLTLTGLRADRAIVLRRGSTASVVDATVAQAAEELASDGAAVTVYTSDTRDLAALAARGRGKVSVRRV